MKRIWINPRLAQDALQSKTALDALSLCVMVKIAFRSGVVKEAKARRLMDLFHVSYKRLKPAIIEGVRRGYFTLEKGTLIAKRIRSEKGYDVALDFNDATPGACPATMTQVCNQLRMLVLYNHIAKQNDLQDTVTKARSPKPGELQQMKSARKKLCKKGMSEQSFVGDDGFRLSYKAIASLLNVCRSRAISIVKRICASGCVGKILQFEETGIHIDDYSKAVREDYAKYGHRGFMVLNNGLVCLQLSNAYRVEDASKIKYHAQR